MLWLAPSVGSWAAGGLDVRLAERCAPPSAQRHRNGVVRCFTEPPSETEGKVISPRGSPLRLRQEEARYDTWDAPLYAEPDRLRASDLNEVLLPDHLDRLKFNNQPLQAYGALFKWEVIFSGLVDLHAESWMAVATKFELPEPDPDDIVRATDMRPERAIQQVFRWTDDWGRTQELAFEHYELYSKAFKSHQFVANDGAPKWLEVLNEYRVPCCFCSRLDEESTDIALKSAGLRQFFDAMVTAEDGCETPEQTYLLSTLKLKRPPMRCVVFEDDPRGVSAAHDAMTKAVAMVGKHPGYDLMHADLRIRTLEELTLMSLREIFKDEAPR